MLVGGLRVPDLSQANVGFQALDDRVCSNRWSSFWPFFTRAFPLIALRIGSTRLLSLYIDMSRIATP
jgi:hypothetical protein